MPTRRPRQKAHFDNDPSAGIHDDDVSLPDDDDTIGGDALQKKKRKAERSKVKQLSQVILSHEQEDAFAHREEQALIASGADVQHAQTLEEQQRRRLMTRLARLKLERKTHAECAEVLGISVKTVYNYMQDPLYREVQTDLIDDAKTRGHVRISETIDDAVDTLYRIMGNAESEFVRFKAAEALLNYAGFNVPREQKITDSRTEVDRFMRVIEEREAQQQKQQQINIHIHPTSSSSFSEGVSIQENTPPIVESDPIPPQLRKYAQNVLPGGKLPSLDD